MGVWFPYGGVHDPHADHLDYHLTKWKSTAPPKRLLFGGWGSSPASSMWMTSSARKLAAPPRVCGSSSLRAQRADNTRRVRARHTSSRRVVRAVIGIESSWGRGRSRCLRSNWRLQWGECTHRARTLAPRLGRPLARCDLTPCRVPPAEWPHGAVRWRRFAAAGSRRLRTYAGCAQQGPARIANDLRRGRLSVVFGCGAIGTRASVPPMGTIAADLAGRDRQYRRQPAHAKTRDASLADICGRPAHGSCHGARHVGLR